MSRCLKEKYVVIASCAAMQLQSKRLINYIQQGF